ncbi:MAG: Zn-ribbon domain-containing OB-fold protein [Vulcanimicrobiaceae bacterium]
MPETDTGAKAFWEGSANGKLLIQRCDGCDCYQHYARPFCTKCGSHKLSMVEAKGRGVVYSFTVIHRGAYDDIPSPYVVALVTLDEGPRLLTNIVNCDPGDIRCDMPVNVTFQPLRDGIVLPVFEPFLSSRA